MIANMLIPTKELRSQELAFFSSTCRVVGSAARRIKVFDADRPESGLDRRGGALIRHRFGRTARDPPTPVEPDHRESDGTADGAPTGWLYLREELAW
jgi:hypothetical protein